MRLPNHFHLVVETPQANLVAGMKWFLGTYTSRFNRRTNPSAISSAGANLYVYFFHIMQVLALPSPERGVMHFEMKLQFTRNRTAAAGPTLEIGANHPGAAGQFSP